MALEVRSVPPRLALALTLLAFFPFRTPAPAQESQKLANSHDAVEAKARLLRELDRQIEERRRQIAREEEGLAALKRALEAAKQALAEERDELVAVQREIEADIARRKKLVDERLTQIARVYGAMKPREAAEALEKMDDGMAVNILERLPGRAVGKIFDVMAKERVRDLTRRLQRGRVEAGAGE